MNLCNCLTNVCRKKTVVNSSLNDTRLKRCLGIFDLVGLGIGSSLGVGIYVVTSYAIGKEAGPSYVISVIIAGVATLLAGLCYAEFSARLPRNGSAYFYTYVTVGELCGFVIGWNMILEHVISATISAKAWSYYVDFLANGTIKRAVGSKLSLGGVGHVFLEDTPDVTAFTLVVFVTIIITIHAKISTMTTVALAFFNLLIITCFVCIGYFHVKHENWTDSPGFFAHGFSGVLNGAATLMFTFTSLEVITSGSEEAREPSRTTPAAITNSIFITSVVYFCVSTAATLSLHKFPEKTLAVLPEVLQTLNVHGASAVISIGGISGLFASVIGVCFCLPRLLYAMSTDKLLCKLFSGVSSSGRLTPIAAVLSGIVVALTSLFLKLEILLQVVSIGTLLAYLGVAISVICMRYQPGTSAIGLYIEYDDFEEGNFMQCTDFTYANFELDASKSKGKMNYKATGHGTRLNSNKLPPQFGEKTKLTNGFSRYNKSFSFDDKITLDKALQKSTIYGKPKESTYTRLDSVISSTSNGSISGLLRLPSDVVLEPNDQTWRRVKIGLLVFILCSLLLCLFQKYVVFYLSSVWILVILILFLALLIAAMVLVARQPHNRTKFHFNTPYLPFIPLLSILVNVVLIAALPAECWIRFIIWMSIGLTIYVAYSYRHSAERTVDDQEVVLYEITDSSMIES